MEHVDFLVVGAGISGLSFAVSAFAEAAAAGRPAPVVRVVERDASPGGYCKTVKQDGFVWDYSGHFFHFRDPEIEAWLIARMPEGTVRRVKKSSLIRCSGRNIDFPFQKNIHQLPRDKFERCLVDLFERPSPTTGSFRDMLVSKFGAGIADLFLIPYNEKLYATDLSTLDADAMGRFFPHAEPEDIVRNIRRGDNTSYNSTFTYPSGGAIEYVNAFVNELDDGVVHYNTMLTSIDLDAHVAQTSAGKVQYRHLITSAPFVHTAKAAGLPVKNDAFTWNKVLIFNLGFDKKGPRNVHWMYFPERQRRFYRVGFYDNIMDTDRMSLYVEIGARADDKLDVDAERERVLADLAAEAIVRDHQLLSHHTVTLDPAYVHIRGSAEREVERVRRELAAHDVYAVGRYGGWTYCAIEDNIVETRALAEQIN